MKTRILAAVVLLPLLFVIVLVLPAVWTGVLFGILAAIGAYELLWRTGLAKNPRLVAYAALMALFIGVHGGLRMSPVWMMLAVFLFSAAVLSELLLSSAKEPFAKIAYTFVAGLVVPMLLLALGRIRSGMYGKFLVLIPFVLAFLSDTGAYFAGRAFGKHKLAPVISPNKTVEGVIGGVVGAMIGMVIYCLVLKFGFHFRVNFLYALIYGLFGSLAAVFGDLCFSAIKRQTGIKDYGNLIPGHGGALDRFDSMTVVAPLAELLMILLPVAVR